MDGAIALCRCGRSESRHWRYRLGDPSRMFNGKTLASCRSFHPFGTRWIANALRMERSIAGRGCMPSDNDDVERWRGLARDARAAAEQVIDPEFKRLLHGIADR